jgi:hypothetical protein
VSGGRPPDADATGWPLLDIDASSVLKKLPETVSKKLACNISRSVPERL